MPLTSRRSICAAVVVVALLVLLTADLASATFGPRKHHRGHRRKSPEQQQQQKDANSNSNLKRDVGKIDVPTVAYLATTYGKQGQAPSNEKFAELGKAANVVSNGDKVDVDAFFDMVGIDDNAKLPLEKNGAAAIVPLRTLLKHDLAEFLRLKAIVEKHKSKWLAIRQLISVGVGRRLATENGKIEKNAQGKQALIFEAKGTKPLEYLEDLAINIRVYNWTGVKENSFDIGSDKAFVQVFISQPNTRKARSRNVGDDPIKYGSGFFPCLNDADAGDNAGDPLCSTGFIAAGGGASYEVTAMHCFGDNAYNMQVNPHLVPVEPNRRHLCNPVEPISNHISQFTTGAVGFVPAHFGFQNPTLAVPVRTVEIMATPVNMAANPTHRAQFISTQMHHPVVNPVNNVPAAPWNTQGYWGVIGWGGFSQYAAKWLAFRIWDRVAKFGFRTQFTTGRISALEDGFVHIIDYAAAAHPRWWYFTNQYIVTSDNVANTDAQDNSMNNFGNSGDSGAAVVFNRVHYNDPTAAVIGVLSNGGFSTALPQAINNGQGVPAGVFTVLPNNNLNNYLVVLNPRPIVGVVPVCDALIKVRGDTGNNNLVVV